MNISFVGAGSVATSLGGLFAKAGHTVKYSVREPKEDLLTVSEACSFGDIVCIAVPFEAVEDILNSNREALKGKLVVDMTNAIDISNWSPIFLGEDSGGEKVARLLPESKVVKAFNSIFADVMKPGSQTFDGQKLTAFIASDDKEAADKVGALANEIGFESLVVGNMINARYLEAMAHLNISIAIGGGGTQAGFGYFQRK